MTRSATLDSINCTSCGAGLSVLGGGRINTHVCGYCGAVLDAQHDYRVLSSIGKRDHPHSPVRIGMRLQVEGVAFTVIGTLGKVETWGSRTWRWVDHQLFSPTHGYAWLTYEGGNFLFTRKLRDQSDWVSTARVERAETPPVTVRAGRRFRYYETTFAEIDFMEGEFNWHPQIGERSETVTLLGDDAMLHFVQGETEREVELTSLLPHAAAMQDLGIPPERVLKPDFHPLTPYAPLPNEGFMRRVLGVATAAALAIGGLFWLDDGNRVLQASMVPVADLPREFPFEITSTAQLSRVTLESNVSNSFAVFETEIAGPDGAPLAAVARVTERYSGVEGGERWSEGSGRSSFLFRPEATGPHVLTLSLDEADTWGRGGDPVTAVSLRIHERVATPFWILLASAGFGAGAMALTGRRTLHAKRRWSGSDWTEED